MKEEPYLTFQRFNDKALAMELADLLRQNNVDFVIDDTTGFDPSFSNSELNKEFRVKLRKQDFEKANALLLHISTAQLEHVEKDYYLFEFTDEELIEIVTKPDEWNQFDYLLAQRILKEHGKEIKPELADTLRKQRIHDLAKTEETSKPMIYAGYALALIGGVIAIFIGWHIVSHKKTLPNGDSVYAYSESDRKHGNRIFMLGIIFLVLWTIARLISDSNR